MSDESEHQPEKIEILSTDDSRLKSLGEVLISESSRKILNIIFDQELTALQIAGKTSLSLELTRYHLKKMVDFGLVTITKIEKSSREQNMKYYKSTKFTIMIFPPAVSDKAKNSKSLLNSVKRIYRFVVIGVVSLIVGLQSASRGVNVPNMSEPSSQPFTPLLIAAVSMLIVIVIGLIIELIIESKRKPTSA
jgi:DNA-binding transcriptional ArsR family regulator